MLQQYSKITVIIPTYNRAGYIAECLDSVLAQTFPAGQVIVINDGSTDNTRQVLEPYLKSIEYFEIDNVGKAGALNYGIEKVTGDYLWIFDDDDVALPDALERFVEPLKYSAEYGFSYGTCFYTPSQANGRIAAPVGQTEIPDIDKTGFLAALLSTNFLTGATLFARTSCYGKVGKFNQQLLRAVDYEMAIRMVRRFKGIRVSGGPAYHYRQHFGSRGPVQDRFTRSRLEEKWLEYGQIIFRRLYREIPLSEYLPPGPGLGRHMRRAILQRMAIMAGKLLLPEVLSDLNQLALLEDRRPFSEEEIDIIRNMCYTRPFGRMNNILSYPEFFDEIRRLSASSGTIRRLRVRVMREITARFRWKPTLNKVPGVLNDFYHLYIPV